LINCNLVLKHQFGQNLSFYESAYNNDFHHHLICTNCHVIQEYKDDEIISAIQSKKIKQFVPSHYSLYIYGLCGSCARKLKTKK
jgi:Fur family ferric uptake transcriptional regulator